MVAIVCLHSLVFGPAPVRPRWRSTGRGRRPAQSRPGPRQHRQGFLDPRGMGVAQGKKVQRRCCAETSKRARALVFGQISPSQRTHASGPVTPGETGDSGDPEGTSRKTRQATTGGDHPGCKQASARPSPTCGPRATRRCTRSDAGRATGSECAARTLDREERQRWKRDQSVPPISRTPRSKTPE